MTLKRTPMLRKLVCLLLVIFIMTSNIPRIQTTASAGSSLPHLLISEIVFNSVQPSGANTEPYEYIEVYNHSNQTVNMEDYKIIYESFDGLNVQEWDLTDDKPVNPGQTIVLWNLTDPDKNGGINDDINLFNQTYGTSLAESQIATFHDGVIYNTGGRSVSIVSDNGQAPIVTASYNAPATGDSSDSANGKSVTYLSPVDGTRHMVKLGSKVYPTPGSLTNDQVFGDPVDNSEDNLKPTIDHTPPTSAIEPQDYLVTATVHDDNQLESVILYYQTDKQSSYNSVPMSVTGATYSAVIPKLELDAASSVNYYFEASDGTNVTHLPEELDQTFQLTVSSGQLYDKLPELLITEIMANPGANQAYEYVEVYNNTDRPVSMKDYKLRIIYENGNTFVDWDLNEDKWLLPQEAIVLWVNNAASQGKSVDNFNNHFGSSLTENQVIRTALNGGGMNNSLKRTMSIVTDMGTELSRASYNDGPVIDVVQLKGIVYHFPKDGTNVMEKRSSQPGTPGQALADQVPSLNNVVKVEDDLFAPVIGHTQSMLSTPPVDISVNASITDNQAIKRVTLHYKLREDLAYTEVNLEKNAEGLFQSSTISKYDLMKTAAFDYYFEASDGQNVASTMDQNNGNAYSIVIEHEAVEPLQLNIHDGDFLSGSKRILGSSSDESEQTSLLLDGVNVPASKALRGDVTFIMEVDGFDANFKNGLLVDNKVFKVFEGVNVIGYETVAITIPGEVWQAGPNVISVSSGNKVGPEETIDNNDDFSFRNARIVLPDGTIIPLDSTKIKMGDGTFVKGPTSLITLGDGNYSDLTAKERADLTFVFPQEKLTGRAYEWDTTATAEGPHTIAFQIDGSVPVRELSAEVVVDNTLPSIVKMSIEDNKTYKGPIPFKLEAVDSLSGVAEIKGTLDGEEITLPTVVNALHLEPHVKHDFEVTITDRAGNSLVNKVSFFVVEEHPNKPTDATPIQGASDVDLNVNMGLTVNDPTGDPLKVTFYKAHQYDFTDNSKKQAFSNSVDREPPLEMVPTGETPFTNKAISAVKAIDENYFSTESKLEFPYHRFEFAVTDDLTGIDQVEVVWRGHSMPERQVTLYTWNYNTGKWEDVASGVGTEDFTLKGFVKIADMVRDQKIQVLVQDLIPSPDQYDFTFMWMSDTQFYTENWPGTYKTMTQWIVDKQEEKKIKYVIHTGDLVEKSYIPEQWQVANDSMKILEDANIPYGVLAGNHDVNHDELRYDEYWEHFGRHRFEDKPWYGGDKDNNRNHYDLISANGNDFIIVYLSWDVSEDTIEWANNVLRKYPDRNAIITTHQYIARYGFYVGQGKELWDNLVSKHENVIMVLSGHIHGAAYAVKRGDNGNVVHEMLADYQGGPEGGQGYMRLLQFDTENKEMHVSTYSPLLDDYISFDETPEIEEFTVPIDLKPIAKQVATDYIGVNVYTSHKIGEKQGVPSGSRAEVLWQLDRPSSIYHWYATLEDEYGGFITSDVYEFTTKSGGSSGGSGGSGGSGSGNPDPNPLPDHLLEVKPEDLAAQDGVVTLPLIGNQEGVALPVNAADLLGQEASIVLKGTLFKLTIPSSVLAEAARLLPVETRKDGTLFAQVKPVDSIRKPNLQPDSKTYEWTIGVIRKDGVVFALNPLKEPVTLTIPASQVKHPKLAGLYFIDNAGKPHQIEGDFADSSYIAKLKEPGSYALYSYNKQYVDLPENHWAYAIIQELSFKGAVNGISENKFAPAKEITRAEFVTMLTRTLGLSTEVIKSPFKDVADDAWYADAVNRAYALGLINGKQSGLFDPQAQITRDEMVVMVVRAIERKTGKPMTEKDSDFKDTDQVDGWAVSAVNKAFTNQLINGRPNGMFEPKGVVTRAESAKLALFLLNQTSS